MGSVGTAKRSLKRLKSSSSRWPPAGGSGEAVSRATSVSGATIALLVLVLLVLGLLMVYSASYALAYEQTGDPNHYLKRQLLAVAVGLGVFILCARLPYRVWMRLDGPFLLLSLGLTAATLVPGVAVGGRWISLGPINLQPTEMLKVALIVYLAASLCRRQEQVAVFSQGVLPHLLVVGVAALLSIAQPDFGMALLFLSIAYFMLFIGGVRFQHLLGTWLLAFPPLALMLVAAPYRRARLLSFLDPFSDANHGGYQVIQSLVSLGSGGLWGRGLGGGVEKLGYLPAAHTDFIFSVLGEELGLWGTSVVLAAFLALGTLGIRVSLAAPDRFGGLLAAGVTFALCLQALLNLGVTVGLLPVTGLTLPFVSYGGSSLLASLGMAGILISIARGDRGRVGR